MNKQDISVQLSFVQDKIQFLSHELYYIFFDIHHVKHLFSNSYLQKYNFFLVFLNLFLLTTVS